MRYGDTDSTYAWIPLWICPYALDLYVKRKLDMCFRRGGVRGLGNLLNLFFLISAKMLSYNLKQERSIPIFPESLQFVVRESCCLILYVSKRSWLRGSFSYVWLFGVPSEAQVPCLSLSFGHRPPQLSSSKQQIQWFIPSEPQRWHLIHPCRLWMCGFPI